MHLEDYGISLESSTGKATLAMLAVLNSMDLTADDAADIARVLLDIATNPQDQGQSFLEERWHPLYAGVVKDEHIVRVTPHRFSGVLSKYNNRVGIIINQKVGRGQVRFFYGGTPHWFSLEDLQYYM